MRAIEERDPFTGKTTWHIPAGHADQAVTYRPIACGGGIAFPGGLVSVPAAELCPDCRAAKRAARVGANA